MAIGFHIVQEDVHTRARAGCLTTDHGVIETPIFMPVGTAGTVKTLLQQQLEQDLQAPIILGNTYHLYLRPGTEVLQEAGGCIASCTGIELCLPIAAAIRCFHWLKSVRLPKRVYGFNRILMDPNIFFSPACNGNPAQNWGRYCDGF